MGLRENLTSSDVNQLIFLAKFAIHLKVIVNSPK